MQSKLSNSSRVGGVGTVLSLILLVTLLTAAVAVFSFKQLQSGIEEDLNDRVATALEDSIGDQFTIDGQAVFLIGAVSTKAQSERAEESAGSVYGVSRVINQLTFGAKSDDAKQNAATTAQSDDTQLIIDTTTTAPVPTTLTIAANDDGVSVQGIVPDKETIELINTALTSNYGRENVTDELSDFEGSESPQWLPGMLAMIDQLDGISNPVLKVTGKDVVVGGTVNAEQIRNAKLATATRLLGEDLNVVDNLTIIEEKQDTAEPAVVAEAPKPAPVEPVETAPVEPAPVEPAPVEKVVKEDPPQKETVAAIAPPIAPSPAPTITKRPASVEISSDNNQISLAGLVASASEADGLREGLNNLFGAGSYSDELEVSDSVANAPWLDDALIVTSEIRDVPDFAINIRAGQMSLSGNVEDRETARDISITATEIAGSRLGVLNNFSVSRISSTDTAEDLLALSLKQELDALPTQNITFNKGSTTLADSAQEVLDDVAAAILGYDGLVVEIAGHTDSTGDAVTNLRLSKQRAAAVSDYLIEQDVPASRLSPIGYGETAPIRDNNTEAGRTANRRIEFNL